MRSGPTGRFKVLVPPGTWKVQATQAGFAPFETTMEVPVLTAPLYQEEARIVREPDSFAQEQAEHGLRLTVGLTRQ